MWFLLFMTFNSVITQNDNGPIDECVPKFGACGENSECCDGLNCDLNTCYVPFVPFQNCESATMAFAGMNAINPGACDSINNGTLTFWKMLRDVGIYPILDRVTWSGTAFGPSNLAFTNFIQQYQNSLTFPQIKQAILYHIVPDVVITPENVTDGMTLATGLSFSPDISVLCDDQQAGDLTIEKLQDGNLKIVANSSVAIAQFGYHQPCYAKMYILDNVLIPCLPLKCNSILSMAQERLPGFVQLLVQAGLSEMVSGKDWKGTILAPDNSVLEVVQPILANLSSDQIRTIVEYHVIPDVVLKQPDLLVQNLSVFYDTYACDEECEVRQNCGEGCPYVVGFDGEGGTVQVEGIFNSVNIISFDVIGCKAVLHYVDGLLIPFEIVGDFF